MPALVRGVHAAIKWQYYIAAVVHGYTIARGDDKRWSVVAQVVERDAFKLTQQPLVFAAPTKAGGWFWPIESYHLSESGRFEARLGAPIE